MALLQKAAKPKLLPSLKNNQPASLCFFRADPLLLILGTCLYLIVLSRENTTNDGDASNLRQLAESLHYLVSDHT